MEEDGQEWVCPKCKKAERAMKGSTLLGKQLNLGDAATASPALLKVGGMVSHISPVKKGVDAASAVKKIDSSLTAKALPAARKIQLSPKKVGASHTIRLPSRKLSEGGREVGDVRDGGDLSVGKCYGTLLPLSSLPLPTSFKPLNSYLLMIIYLVTIW